MFNITAKLDKSSKKPLYEQLYKIIADTIRSGRASENERLPSKKALAAHMGISINTVETAYEILMQEGYIFSKPRSGYFVSKIEPHIESPSKISKEKQPPLPVYKADFKTNTVDMHSFPYSTWIKLSKSVMYETPELLNTGDFKGDFELRKNISKYLYEFRGVHCTPSQIVIGAGMEYLLTLLSIILKGKIYAVENPGYGKAEQIFRNNSGKICYIPLDENGMKIDELTKCNADIAYITPSHQFPTGTVMPIGRRLELLKWASSGNSRYLIEDDYNGEFNFTAKPIPAIQGLISDSRVIYISTFSRTLAPSIRISYMVLPPELMQKYEALFSHYTSTVPRFEQQTLNRFIDGGYFSRHLNRVKNIYRKRCEYLLKILKKYNFQISGEKAGLHLLVKTPFANELLNKALQNSIRIYSLDSYFFTPNSNPSDTLIIGYAGSSSEDFELLDNFLLNFFKLH